MNASGGAWRTRTRLPRAVHAGDLARDGGGRAEYNDCRQIAAPRSTCTRTTAGTAKP